MKAKWTGLALAIIALYLSPYVFQGKDAPFEAHDLMDSNILWTKMAIESGHVWGGVEAEIPQFMHGQSRNALAPEFHVITWLFMLFGPFIGWLLNILIIHLTAFFSMYHLLRRRFLNDESQVLTAWAAAICFALLPFWYPGGLCIAGLPLVVNAFMNIRRDESSWSDYAALAVYALYGWFIHIGIFIIGIYGLIWIWDVVRRKKFHPKFFTALAVLSFFSLLTEYHTFYDVFLKEGFVSHRIEFQKTWIHGAVNFKGLLRTSFDFFIESHPAAFALQVPFIIPAAIFSLTVGFITRNKLAKYVLLLLAAAGCIAFFRQIFTWGPVMSLLEKFSWINAFQFDRWYLFYPLLFLFAFYFSLRIFWEWNKAGRVVVLVLLSLQICWSYVNGYPFWEQIRTKVLKTGPDHIATWNNYYSENLCNTIRDYIGKPQQEYHTLCVGLPPDIFQWNGFYTLDGYLVNYDVAYKHRFRRIIAEEISEDPRTLNYYDGWGSRCYLYTYEIGFDFQNPKTDTLRHLDIDVAAMKEMDGQYLLSSVPVANADSLGFIFLKTFRDSASIWTVHLYEAR